MTDLLSAYDDQLRTDAEVAGALGVDRAGPLWRAVMPWGGFVTYRDLGGLEGRALDAAIADTVRWFRDDTDVDELEWKTRGHDLPADLGERLVAHGLVADDVESVMLGEAAGCAVDVSLPDGVSVRRLDPEDPGAADSLRALVAMQAEVFGRDSVGRFEHAWADLVSGGDEYWLAEDAGQVVCAGRLSPVTGTEFAGIWGGATLPSHRGRGIYRALTAARARSAMARGVRYLHSDSTPMSRPILERSGLVAVTTTTPYRWSR